MTLETHLEAEQSIQQQKLLNKKQNYVKCKILEWVDPPSPEKIILKFWGGRYREENYLSTVALNKFVKFMKSQISFIFKPKYLLGYSSLMQQWSKTCLASTNELRLLRKNLKLF